ncbi:hypothetical protein NVP1063O_209 [Vibrio phage 1.063.O._10N.261.45.C7]|nr:hypothetical protein NVP1063O_209 [Vibrio phage 1.063.O._10N.261.45.C7]
MKSYVDLDSREVVYCSESMTDNLKIHFSISSKWFNVLSAGDFLEGFRTWEEAYSYFKGVSL